MIAQLGGCVYLWILWILLNHFHPCRLLHGSTGNRHLPFRCFFAAQNFMQLLCQENHWTLNIASIVRGQVQLFHGYRSLCNALKRRSKAVEKVLGVHSALAIATVPKAVECQEKMSLPALTTQVLRYHWWLRGGTLLQARCSASSTW